MRHRSVTTLMPDFRWSAATLMPPLLPARHGSSPGQSARPLLIRRQNRDPLRPLIEIGKPFRASEGRCPQAASTASGNFAGCAVDSTTIGTAGSRGSFSATAMPTAVCGSMKWPVSRSTVRMVAATSSSSARPAANSARMSRQRGRRQREAPRLRELSPSRSVPRRRRGDRRRTAAVRNSTRPGCPSTARWSAPHRAIRTCRWRASAPECR